MQSAFCKLLSERLQNVRIIFWDLDGTLGEQPGWLGSEPITKYIKKVDEFKKLLKTLSDQYAIYNVLVSRNGMFCGDEYDTVLSEFYDLGFDEVFSCYRARKHSKVYGFANLFSVLLIDDQLQECLDAQKDGAMALHIGDYFQKALPSDNFAILYPK